MPKTRIARTIDKLRTRELPTPVEVKRTFIGGGIECGCSGCGEVIGGSERAYYCRVGDVVLPFHVVCHETWIRWRPANGSSLVGEASLES